MLLRDLSDAWGWIKDILRRLDRLESGVALENSSITNGRMRFKGGLLRLDAGARLEVEGSVGISGPVYLDGDVEITKTLDVLATTKLRGALELLADLVVKSGGKITIDGIDPMLVGMTSANRPGIQFGSGAQLVGTANGIQLNNATGNGFVTAGPSVSISRGTNKVEVATTGTTVSGPTRLSNLAIAPSGTTVYMVVADSAGNLYRKATAA